MIHEGKVFATMDIMLDEVPDLYNMLPDEEEYQNDIIPCIYHFLDRKRSGEDLEIKTEDVEDIRLMLENFYEDLEG